MKYLPKIFRGFLLRKKKKRIIIDFLRKIFKEKFQRSDKIVQRGPNDQGFSGAFTKLS